MRKLKSRQGNSHISEAARADADSDSASSGGTSGSGRGGGRRHVVLLFADLCGSTALTEAMDPEEFALLRNELEQLTLEVVARHGGSPSQVYGDGVLAVFGYPAPREDDARRAVEATLELHRAVRDANLEAAKRAGFELRLHSAVHAGQVFVRHGDALHGRYELLGDAVNTAARLCDMASRDEILVSQEALSGIEAFFVCDPPKELSLRGRRAPVSASLVRGRTGLRTRLEARAAAGLTRFVGREQELARLLSRVDMASPGYPTVTLVTGDPGVGKSRTLAELQSRVSAQGRRALYGTCESYGEMVPLGPFVLALQQLLSLQSDQTEGRSSAQVAAQLEAIDGRLASHRETFMQLLGLPTSKPRGPSVVEAGEALSALVVALTAEAPLLLVLDDWQWADDASRQVLDQLCSLHAPNGLCIVVGSRPTDAPDPALATVETWALRPFDESDSEKMIEALRPEVLDLGIAGAIYERSGGSPLFLEELCRSLPKNALRGERALEESAVPTTLHGLIQTHVSELPKVQADVLRTAAVLGHEFTPALAPDAFPKQGLDEALAALAGGDLIRPAQQAGAYRFKHGITREVIYESVRLAERRRIHRVLAEALRQQNGQHGGTDSLEALAYHYRGCGDHERAAHFAEKAGDRALATSSLDRARLHYETALAELQALGDDETVRRRWLAIYARWAGVYVYSPSRAQLPTLRLASDYAAELGDNASSAYTGHWRSWLHYTLGEYNQAIHTAEEALALAERIGDDRLRAQLHASVGQCYAAAGEPSKAREHLDLALAMKRARAKHKQSQSLLLGFAYAIAVRASLHAELGETAQARSDITEALAAVAGSGHALEGSVTALECMMLIFCGEWDACVARAEHAKSVASRVNSAYVYAMGTAFGAYASFMREPTQLARQRLGRAIAWLEARDTLLFGSLVYALLADADARAGAFEEAKARAQQALQRGRDRDKLGETIALSVLARVVHADGARNAELQPLLDRVDASAQARGSRRARGVTTLLRAEFASIDGDPRRAAQLAAEALEVLQPMGLSWHCSQARALLPSGEV